MDIIETRRLILRPWREEDAAGLFSYASDPEVGPAAGWAPHESVEDSLRVLRTILMKPDTWAITLRSSGEPIGSVGIFPTDWPEGKGGPEIGYWVARPFWGQGIAPEAVRALVELCFSRGAERVFCAHADFNAKSRRVIEKCGFRYLGDAPWVSALGDTRSCRYYEIPRDYRPDRQPFSFLSDVECIPGQAGLRLELIEKNPGGGPTLPFYYYDILVGERQVGKISLRIGDNYHSYYNGHIGYEINEPDRGHRTSLAALRLLLPLARRHGMRRLFITCRESNLPSRRIIEAAGGRLLQICPLPRDYFAWYEGAEDQCIYQIELEKD